MSETREIIRLMDLTTNDELKLFLKFPNLIKLQAEYFIDIRITDIRSLADAGVYGTLRMEQVFTLLNQRYYGLTMGTWKPEP